MRHGERFNTASHLLGLAVSAAGSAVLLPWAFQHADATAFLGIALFASATLLLYASSIAFHSTHGRARAILERLDHGAIFVLIAGSYTPFALASPRHGVHLGLLARLWLAALAIAGRALARPAAPDLRNYVVLGWLAVAAAIPVALRAGTGAITLLLLGALVYSGGTLFYRNRMGWRHAHGCWHLCVLGGTAAHFAAVSHLVKMP